MEKITIVETWENMGEEATSFCDHLGKTLQNVFPEADVSVALLEGADRTDIYTDCTADDEDLIRELVQKTREDWEVGNWE